MCRETGVKVLRLCVEDIQYDEVMTIENEGRAEMFIEEDCKYVMFDGFVYAAMCTDLPVEGPPLIQIDEAVYCRESEMDATFSTDLTVIL